MQYKELFTFNLDLKNYLMFTFLAFLPNLLGLLHYTTIFGFKVHFFQYAIFLAAILYGPLGGAVSGGIGSLYIALALNNPYLIVGNIILGFFIGLFTKLKLNVFLAISLAFIIQLFWLIPSDIYLAGMPVQAVKMVVISLVVSNIVFAFLSSITATKMQPLLK